MTSPQVCVTLDKLGITYVLHRLARVQSSEARMLYGKLMSSWGHRPDRERVTIKPTQEELRVLTGLDLPRGTLDRGVLASGWLVTYRHPRKPNLEVRVTSKKKPPKKRTFKIGGKRVRLVAIAAQRIKPTKEAVQMARAKTKKKAVDEDDLDELEGLEELDDLEDLDDEEEPDDEDVDEDEDEEEDEEPAPKRSRAKRGKATAKKAPARKSRKAPVEEDDEEEDEEDEDPRKRTSKKAPASKAKPSSKTKSKAKSNGGGLPTTRELPKGKVGPQDIAEMVGDDCDARYVRIWLRDYSDYERAEGGRWAFSKTEARTIAKEIKAHRKG